MRVPSYVAIGAVAGLATLATVAAQTPVPQSFQYRILNVANTQPGQKPVVTISIVDAAGAPYDLQTHPAFLAIATGASRINVQIGWTSLEHTNTGSLSENSAVGAAPALPIAADVLRLLSTASPLVVPNADGTYAVTSPRALPAGITGSGVVAIEGHPAGQDATGAWTVRVPVKSVVKYFPITDASATARRQVVDVAKCKTCHGTLTLHGNNRTDEPRVCVMCHNANATDIAYRQVGDGPEVSIDFKRMVHGIHAGRMRKTPLVVIGFNHSVNDFSTVRFPGKLNNCLTCHVNGSYELPLAAGVLGSTIDSKSTITATSRTIDGSPANDLNVTPIAAVCSSCHDDREALAHMRSKGASFATLQSAIDSGQVKERCVQCHGRGKDKDVRKVHLDDD